jgi:Tol biopolymer transport system component
VVILNRTSFVIWIVALLLATLAPDVLPDDNEKIVFVSDRDGNDEIYVMNADGSNVVRLTDNPAEDGAPAWSPDGRKIAFISDRDFSSDIFVMNADGSNVVKLTDNFATDTNPSFSPDGTKIAFNSDRDGPPQIYVMDADGSNVVRVTDDEGWNAVPAWSPDGKKIAYTCDPMSSLFSTGSLVSQIRVINVDGSNMEKISRKNDSSPAFSPDGEKIVFESSRDGNYEIYVMNADGTNQQRLTNNSFVDFSPSWSPDGKKIVFTSDRDGNRKIYVMNADGSNIRKLTENSYQERRPKWCIQDITTPEPGITAPEPTEAAPGDEDVPQPVQLIVPPYSQESGIELIYISYELHGTHGIHWEYWIARHSDGIYYIDRRLALGIFDYSTTEGEIVGRKLIQKLAESFTDFYLAEQALPSPGWRLDGGVTFEVLVRLENGETLSLNIYPDYQWCCLIPWGITYKDKSYLQLNGKITRAVLGLLAGVGEDEELQVVFDKEIRWECYPVILHYKYYDDTLSDDFPQSEPAATSRETSGEKHVVWDTAVSGIVYPSVYADGILYIATEHHVRALDVETVQELWRVEIETKENSAQQEYMEREGDFIYYKGMVYYAAPPVVYGLAAQTGEPVWEYDLQEEGSLKIFPSRNTLIVWRGDFRNSEIACLDAESGDQKWRITGYLSFLKVVDDRVLYKVRKDENDYQYSYCLMDIRSGGLVWEKESSDFVYWRSNIVNWSYHNGKLYVDKEMEGTLVAVDMNTLEEHVVYSHGKFRSDYESGELVQYCKVFEEGILLSSIELGELESPFAKWNTQLVFLDTKGTEIWDYHYSDSRMGGVYSISGFFYGGWVYNPIEGSEILGKTIYIWRKGGFIEAFNIESGEKVWENEVRDSLTSFHMLDKRLYVIGNDCTVYCLNAETGGILWDLKVCDAHCVVTIDESCESPYESGSISCDCRRLSDAIEIEDGFLVTVGDGVTRVSVEEQTDGFCMGTVLLLLLVVTGSIRQFWQSRSTGTRESSGKGG